MCEACHETHEPEYPHDEYGHYDGITWNPVPVDEFADVRYGLLTPQGVLFECDYYGHETLTQGLTNRGVLNPDTWLSYGGSIHISEGKPDIWENKTVTQKQMDALFDYTVAREIRFDFEKLEVVDESVQTRSTRERPLGAI